MIELTRQVKRVVPMVRERVAVTLYPGGVIGFRRMRTKREYVLPLATCYRQAIEAHQERARAERRKARGLRPLARRGLLR